MNPEIKAKWIEALNSGNYEQGTGALHNDRDMYCCLGVLCELARQEGIVQILAEKKVDPSLAYASVEESTDFSRINLPDVVREWSGFPARDPQSGWDVVSEALVSLNDGKRLTFPLIAQYIEENL